jgi:O-antigen ligase
MKQAIKFLNYLNLISALCLVATSIYYYPVQRMAFYLFFSTYFIEIFLEQKWKNLKLDKKSIYFILLGLFFMLAIIYLPFETSRKYTVLLLEKRLPLLGFAIVGLLGVNKTYRLNYFLNTFIISSIVAILYLVLYRIGLTAFATDPLRADLFTVTRMQYVNSHMGFNFYLNVSIICIWYILTRSWRTTVWWKNYLYIAALTIILYFLSISEGRSGFIVGILLALSFVFFEIWKRRKTMGIVIGFMIPFILIGLASTHKRMSEKSLETEPRLFLWKSASSVIREKPILGYGISDAQEHFDVARAKYETVEFREGWKTYSHLDCHDQYLQTTMEFGVIGLIFLFLIFLYPIFIAKKNQRLFSVMLIALCAYQSTFDMFLTGPFATLFCIIALMILSIENNIIKRNARRITAL